MAISWDKLSSMVDSVNIRSPNALEQLLEEVSFQRRKEKRKCVLEGDAVLVVFDRNVLHRIKDFCFYFQSQIM